MWWIPSSVRSETDNVPFILTTGMIPPDRPSPAVGMAGTRHGCLMPPPPIATAGRSGVKSSEDPPAPAATPEPLGSGISRPPDMGAPAWGDNRSARAVRGVGGRLAGLAEASQAWAVVLGMARPTLPRGQSPHIRQRRISWSSGCVVPEPLLPRQARAPGEDAAPLAAVASGRGHPPAGGIRRPGPGGRRR